MLGTARDVSGKFAIVMTGLELLRQDMTKSVDRVKERAQQVHEMLRDELADAKSQARSGQAQLIRNNNQCLGENLALATMESEKRDSRMTRKIERLLINHDNNYAQTMTSLYKRLDGKADLIIGKLEESLSGSSRDNRSGQKNDPRQTTVGSGTHSHVGAQTRSRKSFEPNQRKRSRAAESSARWINSITPEEDFSSGARLPTGPHVRSVPDLTIILHDTTINDSVFELLNGSLETFITKLSRSTERGEGSRRTLKKPKS